MVSSAKWIFPLGFLFGLGFDTATEVTLLGLSASQAQQGFSLGDFMLFLHCLQRVCPSLIRQTAF
ncbi:hypothetical protein BZM27_52950 [Paraburkholderia steynii]|uniref:Nickel/cobalt efflux system n=1 Tax=Paraburkholderia steynii TaxID=1245441 RepID=A0A4R0X850_9BURK|nr:hypothetical protein BZM27_52950 [Paraburkholderia steynii]